MSYMEPNQAVKLQDEGEVLPDISLSSISAAKPQLYGFRFVNTPPKPNKLKEPLVYPQRSRPNEPN